MSASIIPISECRRLLNLGQTLTLIDVRTPGEFARVHAVGARSVPLDQLDPAAIMRAHGNGDQPIYVICQSGSRSAKACQRLREAGAGHVLSVEGGTSAWEQMGLPVERGVGRVISLERQVRIGAGVLVLVGAVLAWMIHPAFLALPAFVGAGLMFSGITDYCGMGMLLAKMPWNRAGATPSTVAGTST